MRRCTSDTLSYFSNTNDTFTTASFCGLSADQEAPAEHSTAAQASASARRNAPRPASALTPRQVCLEYCTDTPSPKNIGFPTDDAHTPALKGNSTNMEGRLSSRPYIERQGGWKAA